MSLLDFFKPRWKHSDVEVRADAVRQFGEGDEKLLARVVREELDARVRRIALKKIEDPSLLGELAERDADEGLRKAAGEKASALLLATAIGGGDEAAAQAALDKLKGKTVVEVAKLAALPSVRKAALKSIGDAKALADVAKHAGDPEIRLAALKRVDNPATLREVALTDSQAEVALPALDRLSSVADLQAVVKRAKSKAARDEARQRLAAQKERDREELARVEISPEARVKARQQQLLRTVESLSTSANPEEVASELYEVKAEWESFGDGPGEHALRRFERAVTQYEARRKEKAEAEEAQRALGNREENDLATAASLLERIGRADGAGIMEAVEEARAAWKKLGPLAGPGAKKLQDLEKRFLAAVDGAVKRGQAAQSLRSLGERAELLVVRAEQLAEPGTEAGEKKLRGLEKEWAELEAAGGIGEEVAARFASARARVEAAIVDEEQRRTAVRAEAAARLVEIVSRLESLADSDDRKHAEQELRLAGESFDAAGEGGGELRARFQAARDRLVARVQELREAEDWKRWANVPRLEKLCDRAELLMEIAFKEGPDLKQVATELKALQTEWKGAGPAPRERSEALWARFKNATDETFKKCQVHFGKVDEDKAGNLVAKEALCVKAEAIADGAAPEQSPSVWREGGEAIKALQEEWKNVGAVPREQADAVWKRFRAACDRFFDKRKAGFEAKDAERMENMRRQEELCARVEEMADHEEPNWKEWAELIKGYQNDWKSIGPAPRELADAVWQRFRGACDRFFERRKEFFERMDAERAKNLELKLEMCAKAEALAATKIGEDEVTQIKALQAEWKKTGPAPREQADAIWARFRAACDVIFEKLRSPDADEDGPPTEVATGLEGAEAAPGPGMGTSGFVNRIPLDKLSAPGRKRRPRPSETPRANPTTTEAEQEPGQDAATDRDPPCPPTTRRLPTRITLPATWRFIMELAKSPYFSLEREPGSSVVRFRRSAESIPSVEVVAKEMESVIKAVPLASRASLDLLIDLRLAPMKSDPVMQDELQRQSNRVLAGFRRTAVLVRTAVGKLQVSRMSRESGAERTVFQDEREALDFLRTGKA